MTRQRFFIPEMLAHQPIFCSLDERELSRLALGAGEHHVRKNEVLYQKGEKPEGIHLVVSGQVKLALTSPTGVERIVLMAGPGDTFGEEAVFPGRCSPITAQANKESLLLFIERHALAETMRHNHEFTRALMTRMSERLCQVIDNLETCVQRTSAQRVAHFLIQRAPDRAVSFDLELDVNKSTIASQLNLAPETFSRVLNRLSREGLIALKGRHITLRNLDSLRSYAG